MVLSYLSRHGQDLVREASADGRLQLCLLGVATFILILRSLFASISSGSSSKVRKHLFLTIEK